LKFASILMVDRPGFASERRGAADTLIAAVPATPSAMTIVAVVAPRSFLIPMSISSPRWLLPTGRN
jgi:hypothetical protein